MKKAILTGASGFIGSWLAEELVKNGVELALVVRDRARLPKGLLRNPMCTSIEKDIRLLSLSDFEARGYDAFFHLAWSGVSSADKNDIGIQIGNIENSLHCLELCAGIGCGRFLAAGTVAEYALCDNMMDLGALQSPNDMYGATKVAVHNYLNVRARQLGQDFNWVIIPSTFGERRTDNNIITYTIRALLRGEKPKYGNLQQMWDFLYVGEVARAVRLIAEKGSAGKVYGIGSGEYRPLKDYIMRIRDLINPELELGIGDAPGQSRQTFSSCVNIYDLRKDTGFAPNVSFDEGIVKTIEYWKPRA